MNRWQLGGVAAILAAGLLAAPAQGAPVSPDALRGLTQDRGLLQDVQYFHDGRQYCFYPNGWRGPGFYRCGFNWRRGYGWGGPRGWRGWDAPGPRFYDRPRYDRRYERPRYEERRFYDDRRERRRERSY